MKDEIEPAMTWKPHVTVAAIIERDGQYLVVEENDNGQAMLNQPAGHLEADESLVDACIRETLEETAWSFAPSALVGVYQWRHPHSGITYLRFSFSGELGEHDSARSLDADIIRTHWKTRTELETSPLPLRSPLVLTGIDDYEKGQRLPLELLKFIDNS